MRPRAAGATPPPLSDKKKGQKITVSELKHLEKSGTKLEKKRAQFADNIRKKK